MYIVAIDPGMTIGVAIWNGTLFEFEELQPPPRLIHKTLWRFLVKHSVNATTAGVPLRIVCESFEWRMDETAKNRTKIDYTAAELVGVVKHFAQVVDNVYLVMQSASTAKGGFFGTENNDKIEKLSLWRPGMRHAMDALRHLLYYRVFQLQETYILDRLRSVAE